MEHSLAERSTTPDRSALQKWVGLGLGAVAFGVMAVNAVFAAQRSGSTPLQLFLSPYVGLILILAAVSVISGFVRPLRWIQVAAVFGVGIGAALGADAVNLTPFMWLIVSLLLAWEYGYLFADGALRAAIAVLVFLTAWAIGTRAHGAPWVATANGLLAALPIVGVGWVTIVLRAREHARREYQLEQAVRERTRELEATIADRSLLLAELHHRTKNNLQLVSSMLWFEQHTLERDELNTMIDTAQKRIQALAHVHELLYASTDVGDVALAEFLHDYLGEATMMVVSQRLELRATVDVHDRVRTDLAIRIGLMLNEIVLNSAERSSRSERTQSMHLVVLQHDREIRFEIEDDVPHAVDERANRSGLGEEIIVAMVESLGGHSVLTRDDGTIWEIMIPMDHDVSRWD